MQGHYANGKFRRGGRLADYEAIYRLGIATHPTQALRLPPPSRIRIRWQYQEHKHCRRVTPVISVRFPSPTLRPTSKETITKLDSITPEDFATDAERYEAKEAARRLLARLETPFERGWALAFETPVLVAGLQLGLDLGIRPAWASEHEKSGEAPQELGTISGWCTEELEENLLRESFVVPVFVAWCV